MNADITIDVCDETDNVLCGFVYVGDTSIPFAIIGDSKIMLYPAATKGTLPATAEETDAAANAIRESFPGGESALCDVQYMTKTKEFNTGHEYFPRDPGSDECLAFRDLPAGTRAVMAAQQSRFLN